MFFCIFNTQIQWDRRYDGNTGEDCLVSVDCTDCRIREQGPTFYSYKFKKSALRYEVAICIKTGDIVWVNGGYAPGEYNDLDIFRDSLMHMLDQYERVEADDGYVGEHPQKIKCPKGFCNPEETEFMQQRVRNRQESVNNRFKVWGCLKQVWRHHIPDHSDAFHAIAVITQIQIDYGDRLFNCGYRDPPYD